MVTSSNAQATIEAAATTPEAAPKLPPNLSVSAPLAQVIKLTQSGVDEKLLLSFITNTTGVFGLGAEEIIYLNDLGVPGDLTAPAFTEAIEHVLAAGRRRGKACGLLVADGAAAARRLEQGWSFVGIGSDSTLLAAAVTAEFGRARTAIKSEPE